MDLLSRYDEYQRYHRENNVLNVVIDPGNIIATLTDNNGASHQAAYREVDGVTAAPMAIWYPQFDNNRNGYISVTLNPTSPTDGNVIINLVDREGVISQVVAFYDKATDRITRPTTIPYCDGMLTCCQVTPKNRFHIPPGDVMIHYVTKTGRLHSMIAKFDGATNQILPPSDYRPTPTTTAPTRATPKVPARPTPKVPTTGSANNVYEAFNLDRNFDPFDFAKYPDDYRLFSRYYSGSELYTRLAVWLLYKHTWLQREPDQNKLMDQISRINNPESILDNMTMMYLPDQLLAYWYLHFNPSKATIPHIELITSRYSEDYEEMWRRLYNRYVTG